jgi:hypothetical protein
VPARPRAGSAPRSAGLGRLSRQRYTRPVHARGPALALVLALAPCLASAPAHAQRAGVDSKAAAEALFDHGRQLHAAGRYAEACPKFAESQKLDAGVGTLLYLADCYEKIGQTASAWAGFREAAAAAKNAGQEEREKIARDRAAALEPHLSRLTITVDAGGEAVEVRRNGVPVGKPLWGTAIPVDPGRHTLSASAPGKKTWTGRVDVAHNGAAASIRVPRLVDAPASPPPGDAAGGGDGSRGAGQRAAGLVLGGVGIGGLVLGAVFGAQAIAKDGDADNNCRPDDPTLCTQRGLDLADDASTAATVSTIAFAAGGVALLAGGLLFFTAPRGAPATRGARHAPAASLRLAPAIGPGAGGVRASGAF